MRRVLMIDQDINHVNNVKEYFKNFNDIKLVTCTNKKDALVYINNNFDIIILNLIMDGLDSVDILSKINKDTILILTSELFIPSIINLVNKYNPYYFIKKPYHLNELDKLIMNCNKFNANYNISVKITDLLHSLGVPSNIKGFIYIRDCIEILYNSSSFYNSFSKDIYPKVAILHNANSKSVERAIRHAIDISWIRGDYNIIEKMFGSSIDFDRSKPTNSEFILTITDNLKIKELFA